MLIIKDFTFTYPGGSSPVLNSIDLELKSGQMVALVGNSGSGKSTLLQALAGLVPRMVKGIFKGDITVKGLSLLDSNHSPTARPQIGLIGSDPRLSLSGVCSTVREEIAWGLGNLGIAPEIMLKKTERVIEQLGLKELDRRHPLSISSGEQQRLALASNLVLDPALLLLDDPSAFLDPRGTEELFTYIQSLSASGRLIIWAFSRLNEKHKFDKYLKLNDGKITLVTESELVNASSKVRTTSWSTGPAPKLKVEHVQTEGTDVQNSASLRAGNIEAVTKNEVGRPEFRVTFEHVSYSYPDGTSALNDINLSLAVPQCVAICGANGAGKTTLAKMFNGLIRPQSGTINLIGAPTLFQGWPQSTSNSIKELYSASDPPSTAEQVVIDTKNIPIWRLATLSSFVFHDPRNQFFSSTAAQEIAFGPHNLHLDLHEVSQRCEEALKLTQLSPYAHKHPYELSRAQMQLLALASSLTMHPRAIIMDEPTAVLDDEGWNLFIAILHYLRYQRPTLTVLITHDLRLVRKHVERVIFLEKGQIKADAPPQDLPLERLLWQDKG